MPRARRILACTAFAVVVTWVLATGCSAASGQQDASNQTVVTISSGTCGHGWLHPHTGLQTFQLRNDSAGVAEVYLINPLQGSIDPDSASAPVFAELEGLGPGTTAPMQGQRGIGQLRVRL